MILNSPLGKLEVANHGCKISMDGKVHGCLFGLFNRIHWLQE